MIAQELHKPIIRKFKRRKVYSIFKDMIWASQYFLCVIDVFSKYVCVKHFTNKKAKTAIDGLIKIINESNHKVNKLWCWSKKRIL